jgi:hypothetical protein
VELHLCSEYLPIARLAISIANTDADQRHIGLLYRIEGAPLEMLHLQWHCLLRSQTPEQIQNDFPNHSYVWISLHNDFDPRLIVAFVEWLGTVWKRNRDKGLIPFSIEYHGCYFDSDGTYRPTAVGEGLTCATFIMALFGDYGLPLIDLQGWKRRLGDASWQKRILARLRSHADPEHIENQTPHIGAAARFRPEEVAGAFSDYVDRPIKFPRCETLAKRIRDRLPPFTPEAGRG